MTLISFGELNVDDCILQFIRSGPNIQAMFKLFKAGAVSPENYYNVEYVSAAVYRIGSTNPPCSKFEMILTDGGVWPCCVFEDDKLFRLDDNEILDHIIAQSL